MATTLHSRPAAARVLFASGTIPSVAQLERFLFRGSAPVPGKAHRVRLDMVRGFSLGRALAIDAARSLWQDGNRACAWCDNPIRSLADAEELGLSLVHHSCAAEFGEWANEDEDARLEREHGPRARQALADVLAGVPMPDDGEDF